MKKNGEKVFANTTFIELLWFHWKEGGGEGVCDATRPNG